MSQDKWLEWSVRLQALAQTGLAYGKDVYDMERFEEIRQIAAEMLVEPSGQPLEVVKDLFCNETGYRHPSWIPAQLFSKRIKSYLSRKTMGSGPCQVVGAMWISRSRTMLSRRSRKKRGWMWRLSVWWQFWTSTRTILPSQPTA